MAKVSVIKYEIDGIKYATNVNCKSDGQFTCYLPDVVVKALAVNREMRFATLHELEKHFNDVLDRYKTANTTQELYIFLRYGAIGKFAVKEDGLPLFGEYLNKYDIAISFSTGCSALRFDFFVVIKETVDTVTKYYKTFEQDGEYNKKNNASVYSPEDYKHVPYSDAALTTLKRARENLRRISEQLFNFIEQDEKTIELALTNMKLLATKIAP